MRSLPTLGGLEDTQIERLVGLKERRGTPATPQDLAAHDCLHYLRPGDAPAWQLAPVDGEWEALSAEHQRLAHGQALIDAARQALELIAAGTAIDYDGASGVTLIGPGESAGRYRQFEVKGGKYETVQFR